MITKENLTELLKALGFHKEGATHSKSFGAATLAVNISKEEIIYPEEQGIVVNERQTCNFSANENFVVFECVHRLLEKDDLKYTLFYTKEILKLTSCHFFILTPFRGSKYYNKFIKQYPNEFLTLNPDHYSIRQSVLKPSNMAIEEFHYCYAELQKKFNSDTIPFDYNDKFSDKVLEDEFLELKAKNEDLYREILISHTHYDNLT